MPGGRYYTSHVHTPKIDSARSASCHEQKNSYIALYMWGGMVRSPTKFWHLRPQWCTYWWQATYCWQASHPLFPPFLRHCTAVVDMTVVTAKNWLRLLYLDTEHLFSLPYCFSDGKHCGVTLIRRGKVMSPNLHRLCDSCCSVLFIVASSPVSPFLCC